LEHKNSFTFNSVDQTIKSHNNIKQHCSNPKAYTTEYAYTYEVKAQTTKNHSRIKKKIVEENK
jgi:hypothetical protein